MFVVQVDISCKSESRYPVVNQGLPPAAVLEAGQPGVAKVMGVGVAMDDAGSCYQVAFCLSHGENLCVCVCVCVCAQKHSLDAYVHVLLATRAAFSVGLLPLCNLLLRLYPHLRNLSLLATRPHLPLWHWDSDRVPV